MGGKMAILLGFMGILFAGWLAYVFDFGQFCKICHA